MRSHYQRALKNHLAIPFVRFINQERSGGIVLALAVIVALALANSPLRDEYNRFFDYHFGFMFNGKPFLNFSVAHWINDGFMSMFFFVVGLELKSEFIGGELRDIRKVTLPVAAALLGMVVPAVLYLLLNGSAPAANGWGIPMATDIAFALAVVYMLGDRVPISAKVFLTTLAIVDDIGAVLVIALFYTSEISFANLAVGFAVLGVMFLANRLGVKNVVFYGLLGIGGVWLAFLMSGIHATIAAVLAAMVIPADSRIPETAFIARIKRHVRLFENMEGNDVRTLEPGQVDILSKVSADTIHAVPPLQRLEHGLHPWVSFVVMPMFALANAGVSFVDMDMSAITGSHVAAGVLVGLLVGKPLGIAAAVWLTEKTGLGTRSRSLTWRRVVGLSFLASIGFTMSMFVTMLAFDDVAFQVQAKVGIFAASILGGVTGYLILRK